MSLSNPRKLNAGELKEYAARLLGGRALSAGEVRAKLNQRATNPEDVEAVMIALKELGFLDDRRFAEHFAGARASSGAFGRQRVLTDLRKRRVGSQLAEGAVREAFTGVDETAAIEAWIERKYRGKDLPSMLKDESKLASAYRRLRTAGFSAGGSVKVLRRFSAQAEALPESEEAEGAGE